MIRGLGTSRSGMAMEMTRVDVISNNVANKNTDGFKRQEAVGKEFGSIILNRMGDQGPVGSSTAPVVGSVGEGTVLDTVSTMRTEGSFRLSENPLEIAIEGPGAITYQTPGGVQSTRRGNLHVTAAGQLVTDEGNPVLVNGQPFTAPGSAIGIREDGTVLVDGQPAGRLDITGAVAGQTRLRSNAMEESNVDLAAEMTDLIVAVRSFQANQRALQMQDESLGRAVNDIGKV